MEMRTPSWRAVMKGIFRLPWARIAQRKDVMLASAGAAMSAPAK